VSERLEIERILDATYAARRQHDVDGVLETFCTDCKFVMGGADGKPLNKNGQRAALEQLFGAFELQHSHEFCRVIDLPRAVVHWRGVFRGRASGRTAETDVLDLFEIRDGKIVSLDSFYDTALAAQLLA